MPNAGTEPISSVCLGEQPIKASYVGEQLIWERPGGYVFITLVTDPNYQPNNSNP